MFLPHSEKQLPVMEAVRGDGDIWRRSYWRWKRLEKKLPVMEAFGDQVGADNGGNMLQDGVDNGGIGDGGDGGEVGDGGHRRQWRPSEVKLTPREERHGRRFGR